MTIKDRYEDAHALKEYYIRAIFDTLMISKESLPAVWNLIDSTNNNLLVLKTLGEPMGY